MALYWFQPCFNPVFFLTAEKGDKEVFAEVSTVFSAPQRETNYLYSFLASVPLRFKNFNNLLSNYREPWPFKNLCLFKHFNGTKFSDGISGYKKIYKKRNKFSF